MIFAAFSLIWPDSSSAAGLRRSHCMALAFLGIAALALLAGPIEAAVADWAAERANRRRGAGDPAGQGPEARVLALVSFLRTFYPQPLIAAFFTESILLSARALGGVPRDAFFMAADQAIFGFQPAREFHRIFGGLAWLNEIMFAVYFLYFAFMVVTIWLPYLRGERAESERQLFVVVGLVAVTSIWYVFFRVEGPKYWLPDLKGAWYDGIEGGLFVGLFKRSLAHATLSGAAFPSTHVMLTLATLVLAFRNDRRFFMVYLPVAILIVCSTVYIYAHWAVDALGGALFAAVLGPLLYRAYGRLAGESRGASQGA